MAKTKTGKTFNLKKAVDEIVAILDKDPRKIQLFKSVSHICAFFSISRETWYQHLKKTEDDAELHDTIKMITTKADAWWIDAGLSGKVNSTAWIFCRKNIAGWRDRPEDENNSNININYSVVKKEKKNGS